jgi:hypothetical protein
VQRYRAEDGKADAMAVSDLERRIDTLESIEAIKKLKHQYCAYCDDNYNPDGIASQFVEDGVWDAGEAFGRYEGRAAIREFFAGVSGQIIFAGHLVMNEQIDVDVENDTARGLWWIVMPATMMQDAAPTAIWLLGQYDDQYVRRDGTWLFQNLKATIHFVAPHKDGWVET